MKHKINAAFQFVPLANKTKSFALIDRVIELIKDSRLEYEVTPFNTVVNGSMKQVMKLADKIYTVCNKQFADGDYLLNIQIHFTNRNNCIFKDKLKAKSTRA